MYRCLLLGIAAAVAVLAVAFGGAGSAVRADGGGSISGRIIHDLDGDGDPSDADEPGLSGWLVMLWRETEEGTSDHRETRTDRDGAYRFAGLADGDYTVSIPCEHQPDLWIATWPSSSWVHYGITVTEGEDEGGNDFLLRVLDRPPQSTGSISGRLAWDENRNTQPDPSERGAAGWTVEIGMQGPPQCFAAIETQRATTSADGTFTLSGLIAGTYVASMAYPPEGTNASYVLDYPGFSEQYTGWEGYNFDAPVEVPEGGTGHLAIGILDVSGTASILGEFYWDQNRNGVREADEALVDCECFIGIMVRTPLGFAPIFGQVTTTMGDGHYSYAALAAGEYRILIRPSPLVTGGDGIKTITVSQGAHLTGVDFGLWFAPDQPVPTIGPSPVSPTPEATNTPPPPVDTSGSINVGPPSTGSGSAASNGDGETVPAVLALGGIVALALAAREWRRRTRQTH